MSLLRVSWILVVSLAFIASIALGTHVPSPYRFTCPPKKGGSGMKDVMACATNFKFMLDNACKKVGNGPIPIDLLKNLIKHVFFHAIKCFDDNYEAFLIEGVADCALGENSPGAKMACNIRASVCDKKAQGEMTACAMKEVQLHKIDMAKIMKSLGHIGKLCNMLAAGCHREARNKWKDFPALPVKT